VDGSDAARPGPRRTVLRTQLVAPPPRPHALPRASLTERLDAVSAPGRLTLVVAGAGWGKTTLVASWIRAEPGPAAWFSVDATDSDPVRFWGGVAAALDGVVPGLTGRSVQLLGAPGTSTATDMVPALLDELAALDAPVTLVVDDYHLADSAEVHRGVAFLVTHLPATLRLVLVSRTEPPLPLARLRGQGRVAELGVEDLRLSAAESAELLAAEADATGTVWPPGDAARLHARTEGWIIGVHLGVLSRRGHSATAPSWPSPLATSRPGDERARHLVGYLRGEVLTPLPDDLRRVLRRTAILDAFRADLAVAVTGEPDAADLLARAEREQLFVVPLDVRGDWFRFHHLFAEVLRDDLARTEPDLVPQLHTRAAQWLAAYDQPVAAVRHALAGDDPELTVALVARHAPVLTRIGQVETALGWFRTLGDDVCRADPRLAAARALTGAHTGRPHEIVSWAAAAEQALDAPAPGRPQLTPGETTAARIEIAMLRWAAAIFAGEFAASRRHVDEALRLFPAGAGAPSGFMLLALGVSRFRTGEADASWATLVEAESVAEDRGEPLAVVAARGLRALQAAVGGRLEEAARLAAGAATVAEQNGLVEHFNTATLRAAQGWVALHTGRQRKAVDLFRRALELVQRGGLRVEVAEVLTALAMAEERLGREAAAREHREEAERVVATCPDPGHMWADPRAPARRPSATPVGNGVVLSPRQTEILRLLAAALTTVEIGERLQLSPRTVEAHLRTLYRKLGVRSRTAAARYAVEHGLTDGE
jgi:LuxR family transcriptional regulator, maltose regulon positive regulatory protein